MQGGFANVKSTSERDISLFLRLLLQKGEAPTIPADAGQYNSRGRQDSRLGASRAWSRSASFSVCFIFFASYFLRITLFGRYTQNKSFLQVCGHSDFLITIHFFFGICSNRLSFPVFSNLSRMLQIVFSTLMIPVMPSAIMPALQSSCNAWICSSV